MCNRVLKSKDFMPCRRTKFSFGSSMRWYSSSNVYVVDLLNFYMWMPVELRAMCAPLEPPLFTDNYSKKKGKITLSCFVELLQFFINREGVWTRSEIRWILPKVMILYRKRSVLSILWVCSQNLRAFSFKRLHSYARACGSSFRFSVTSKLQRCVAVVTSTLLATRLLSRCDF